MPSQVILAEFSRLFNLVNVPDQGKHISFTANPEECALVADRIGILAVHSIVVDIVVTLGNGHKLIIDGRLQASVAQTCVITLQPVKQQIDEKFHLCLAEESFKTQSDLDHSDPDNEVDDYFASRESIDLGEIATQQLSLALDPYPRAEGAVLPSCAVDDDATVSCSIGADTHKPFATGLADLKKKLTGQSKDGVGTSGKKPKS